MLWKYSESIELGTESDRYVLYISVHATPSIDEGAFEDASFQLDTHRTWQVVLSSLLFSNLWLSPFGIAVGPDTKKFIDSISRALALYGINFS